MFSLKKLEKSMKKFVKIIMNHSRFVLLSEPLPFLIESCYLFVTRSGKRYNSAQLMNLSYAQI